MKKNCRLPCEQCIECEHYVSYTNGMESYIVCTYKENDMKQKEVNNSEVIKLVTDALNLLCTKVNEQLFENCRDWYWVGDIAGGICCFDDTDYLSVDDMFLIINENVSYDTYAEWHFAELDNPQKHINLRSWLKGLRHNMVK